MNVLAVSTSARIATAAIIVDGVCKRELMAPADKRHAETVLPLVETLLQEMSASLDGMDYLAVDVGPGSFTGVRIGVSACNAIAMAKHKPIVPVDSLRAIYQQYRHSYASDAERVCVLLDAGNGNGYAAQFAENRVLSGPEAIELAPYREALLPGTRLLTDCDSASVMPRAGAVGEAAAFLYDENHQQISALPLYLRPSQAERMWKLRQEGKRV